MRIGEDKESTFLVEIITTKIVCDKIDKGSVFLDDLNITKIVCDKIGKIR